MKIFFWKNFARKNFHCNIFLSTSATYNEKLLLRCHWSSPPPPLFLLHRPLFICDSGVVFGPWFRNRRASSFLLRIGEKFDFRWRSKRKRFLRLWLLSTKPLPIYFSSYFSFQLFLLDDTHKVSQVQKKKNKQKK